LVDYLQREVPHMKATGSTPEDIFTDINLEFKTTQFHQQVKNDLTSSKIEDADLRREAFPTYWFAQMVHIVLLQEKAFNDPKHPDDPNGTAAALDIKDVVNDMDDQLNKVFKKELTKYRLDKITPLSCSSKPTVVQPELRVEFWFGGKIAIFPTPYTDRDVTITLNGKRCSFTDNFTGEPFSEVEYNTVFAKVWGLENDIVEYFEDGEVYNQGGIEKVTQQREDTISRVHDELDHIFQSYDEMLEELQKLHDRPVPPRT